MNKCIVLNILDLTPKKKELLNNILLEYFRVLNLTIDKIPFALDSTDLHHLTYSNIRKTSFLPSGIIQEARKDAWKLHKIIEVSNYTGSFGYKSISIRLNHRWFKYIKTKRGNPCFKITYSPRKQFTIPIRLDKQFERFKFFLKKDWLFNHVSILKDGKIAVLLKKEFPKPIDNKRFIIGVDIGSSTLASVSVFDSKTSKVIKQYYFGRDIARRQHKFIERRAKLKSLSDNGFHQAKRSLKRLKHKQFNFIKTRSGQLSKEIINLAIKYNASISIEKLKNLRVVKGQMNKKARKKINMIPYHRFIEFLKSNSELFQVPLSEVDAYHTSKWCVRCGAVNKGHHSKNYSLYKCRCCGLIVNSDRKASLVIAIKSLLERTVHSPNSDSVQVSKRQVPVNGLLRPNAVG